MVVVSTTAFHAVDMRNAVGWWLPGKKIITNNSVYILKLLKIQQITFKGKQIVFK